MQPNEENKPAETPAASPVDNPAPTTLISPEAPEPKVDASALNEPTTPVPEAAQVIAPDPSAIPPETVASPEPEPSEPEKPTVIPAAASPVTDAPAPPEPTAPATPMMISASQMAKGKSGKKWRLFALIGLGLAVLLGGSAAAYYGVIIPNKPENVLKQAFANTLQEKQITFDGKASFESTEENSFIKAVDVTLKGQADSEKKVSQAELQVTASGVKLPLEMRYVEQNLYLKLGDLSTVKGLISGFSPEYAGSLEPVFSKLSNQWIEIDHTLLKQAKADCVLDNAYTLSKDDIEAISQSYDKQPFAVIQAKSTENVNGKAAYKYQLELDDNKGNEFVKGLKDISLFKKLRECSGGNDTFDTKALADNDKTPLTVWIDTASKRIVKLSGHTTAQDEQKDHMKGEVEVTLSYGGVTVTKPDNAKPLLSFASELQSTSGNVVPFDLLGAFTAPDKAKDTERQTDIKAMHGQIEAYYAQNGFYPTLANLNDANWRSTNLKGLDDEALKDPEGTAKVLAATPAAKIYSYQVSRAGGGTCDNKKNECAQYTLTATLSDGTTFTKQNLN
jgi:hypothetical protein